MTRHRRALRTIVGAAAGTGNCAVERKQQRVGRGIACQQSCIDSLARRKELHIKLAAHLKNMKRMSILGSFFSIGMGILFIYFSYQGYGLVYDFVLLLGIGFTVYGFVAQFVNMLIFFKKKKT